MVIVACILFTATAWYATSEIQILTMTLNGQFATIPTSQPVAGNVSTSTPVLPQIFFSYLFILSGLAAADLATVQVLRGKLHNSKASRVMTSTESSQLG